MTTTTTTTKTVDAQGTNATAATTVAPTPAVTAASPLADRVAAAVALVESALALLALEAPALTAAQRKGMTKLRKGGEKLVPQIAQIADAWGVHLRTQPTAAMTGAMQVATELAPLIQLLVGFLQEVQDTGFQAASDSWSTATALYSVLKRMSRKDPKLKAQLAPIAAVFAYRHPVVKAAAAPTAATPGKTARRKQKVLKAAEAIVAAEKKSAPPPGVTNGASGANGANGANGIATSPVAHA